MEGEHRELVERDLFGRIVQSRIVVVLLFYVGGSDALDRYVRTILGWPRVSVLGFREQVLIEACLVPSFQSQSETADRPMHGSKSPSNSPNCLQFRWVGKKGKMCVIYLRMGLTTRRHLKCVEGGNGETYRGLKTKASFLTYRTAHCEQCKRM